MSIKFLALCNSTGFCLGSNSSHAGFLEVSSRMCLTTRLRSSLVLVKSTIFIVSTLGSVLLNGLSFVILKYILNTSSSFQQVQSIMFLSAVLCVLAFVSQGKRLSNFAKCGKLVKIYKYWENGLRKDKEIRKNIHLTLDWISVWKPCTEYIPRRE